MTDTTPAVTDQGRPYRPLPKRRLVNYLTGTVPEDPWWMYVYNVAILLLCLALFVVIGVSW